MNPDDDLKLKFLQQTLRCPSCAKSSFSISSNAAKCLKCGAEFETAGSALNFLDKNLKEKHEIAQTDLVSENDTGHVPHPIMQYAFERGGWGLDCGSGQKKYRHERLIQVEIVPYSNVDVLAVNQSLPFADNTFDVVFSLDVLEHVDDPMLSANELIRVLKPGGIMLVDIPFMQCEHGYPHHYFNMTRMGFRKLFKDKLEVLTHFVPASGQPIEVIWQLISHYNHHLPANLRDRFLNLKLKEILERSYEEWLTDPLVQFLSEEGRWLCASTTQGILRKPVSNHSEISVSSGFDPSSQEIYTNPFANIPLIDSAVATIKTDMSESANNLTHQPVRKTKIHRLLKLFALFLPWGIVKLVSDAASKRLNST
jgi:SAM-dependent methyltransferase